MSLSARRLAPLGAAACLGALLVLLAQYAARRWQGANVGGSDVAVLATVDGQPITADDFEREFHRRGGAASFPRAENRRALLDDMIREAVLVASARRAGYDRDPETVRVTRQILAGRYREEHIAAELQNVTVGDDEVRAFYDAHPERFAIAAAAHAALLFVAVKPGDSPARREEKTALAAELHAAAAKQDATADFGALAARSYDRASRYQGGDIGWLRRGRTDSRFEPEVLETIFALEEPGALSPVLTTERGHYVIRLLERKPATSEPLDKVAVSIRHMLLRDKRQERADALYAAAANAVPVQIDEQRLATIDLPEGELVEGPEAPPPVPQG